MTRWCVIINSRHLVRPAEDADAVAVFAGAFDELGPQLGVAPDGDGELGVGDLEQTVDAPCRPFLCRN